MRRGELSLTRLRGVLLAALALVGACTGDGGRDTGAQRRPNVLIVLTDDQRIGTLQVMDKTRRWFADGGTRFTSAFATTPQCCPSRASIFTGRYAHNHRVRNNKQPYKLDQSTTMQRYLQEVGYRTALFGKFLNNWRISDDPPHFDEWAIPEGKEGGEDASYFHAPWNVDGVIDEIERYSTDFLGELALDFLDRTETDDDRPWFLLVSTRAPHAPFEPAPVYETASVPKWRVSPSVRERDLGDKPPFVREFGAKEVFTRDQVRAMREDQLRTLMSVDDLVDEVLSRLSDLDEDADTLAIFMSDNGLLWREHGLAGAWYGKRVPYDGAARIPLMVRWPGRTNGSSDDRLAANIDIAPTVLEGAGIEAATDGISLFGPRRERLLLEHWRDDRTNIPDWAAIRTKRFLYAEYYGVSDEVFFREYFDLATDPHELENVLGDQDPANDPPNLSELSEDLRRFRRCSGTSCP